MGFFNNFVNAVKDDLQNKVDKQNEYIEDARRLDNRTLLAKIKSTSDVNRRQAYIYVAKERGLDS